MLVGCTRQVFSGVWEGGQACQAAPGGLRAVLENLGQSRQQCLPRALSAVTRGASQPASHRHP